MHNKIFGKSPDLLKEMLEIRGIGTINVSRMFGVSSVLPKTEVDFEIRWKLGIVMKTMIELALKKRSMKIS